MTIETKLQWKLECKTMIELDNFIRKPSCITKILFKRGDNSGKIMCDYHTDNQVLHLHCTKVTVESGVNVYKWWWSYYHLLNGIF